MSPIREDELRARLRAVEPSPALPGLAERIIEQGASRRRRRRWAVGLAAAAAVGVIGVGALAVGDGIGRDDALPASPSPTPTVVETTPVVTPTGSPTGSPTASPTATPTGSASSTPTASSSSDQVLDPTPGPSRSTAPPPITFLHDGSSGWTTTNAVAGPCNQDALAIAARHDAYQYGALFGQGIDGDPTGEAYVLFADARAAMSFMGDLRHLSRSCESTTEGAKGGVVADLPGPWGEGLASTYFAFSPDRSTAGGSVLLAVRSGRAVALSTAAGPFSETDVVNPGLIRSARPAVEHLYPQLCRYTEAGC